MKVQTLRFGEIEVDADTVITMADGLVGMPEARSFCLIEESDKLPIKWLQAIGEPALAFVVANPYDFHPEYEFELSEADGELLGLSCPKEAAVMVLLTIGPGARTMTANLVAPVVVCTRTRKAKQVILEDSRYITKHPLVGGGLAAAHSAP